MKRQRFILRIEGDVDDPIVTGPYESEEERTSAARRIRERFGDGDWVYRLDAWTGYRAPDVTPFGFSELAGPVEEVAP